MPSIHLLEDPQDLDVGGVLVTWDDPGLPKVRKDARWRLGGPVLVEGTARRVVEGLIEGLRRDGLDVLISNTNWVSLTAGVCHMLTVWNAAAEKRLLERATLADLSSGGAGVSN